MLSLSWKEQIYTKYSSLSNLPRTLPILLQILSVIFMQLAFHSTKVLKITFD